MDEAIKALEANPTLLYMLKRALGDDNMSFEDALRKSIEQATDVRGLQLALHDAIIRNKGEVPLSAKRFFSSAEMRYAEIRQLR